VLGRPAALRPGSVVIGPDQLVEETGAAEDLVQQQLAVVRLAVVDVEVEGPLRSEQAVSMTQAGLEERQIVIEAVLIAVRLQLLGPVARTAEAPSATLLVAGHPERRVAPGTAGVERGIQIDQLKALVLQSREQLEVLTQQDPVGLTALARGIHPLEVRGVRRWDRRRRPPARPAQKPRP